VQPAWGIQLDDQALSAIVYSGIYASANVLGCDGIYNAMDGDHIHVACFSLGKGCAIQKQQRDQEKAHK